jgi:hypothetical protein
MANAPAIPPSVSLFESSMNNMIIPIIDRMIREMQNDFWVFEIDL